MNCAVFDNSKEREKIQRGINREFLKNKLSRTNSIRRNNCLQAFPNQSSVKYVSLFISRRKAGQRIQLQLFLVIQIFSFQFDTTNTDRSKQLHQTFSNKTSVNYFILLILILKTGQRTELQAPLLRPYFPLTV